MTDKPTANDAALPAGPKQADRNTTFLKDPVSDHLLRAVVTLAMELSVSRERVKTLEMLLVESGALPEGATDNYEPAGDEVTQRGADRSALIASILDPIMLDMAQEK